MKTQIITALSIAAVLGSAGGAYAINQTMLSTASNEQSVIGSATPVLVPVAPKGNDIPDEYLQQLADAENASKLTPLGTVSSSSSDTTPSPSPSSSSDDSYDDSDDDDSDDSIDDHDETEDEHEDESGDDD